jgi:hypothetical protein
VENLQLLIIDEISMVGERTLFDISQRLNEIKGMPSDELFGGISVLAVGDFYQRKPVLQPYIFGAP